jgi:site-specific recombinase XerC
LVANKGAEDFVFSAPNGGPIRHGNFYARHFKPAVVQAGLPETVRLHDLRHSYASFLIAEGAHPRAIFERMVHSTITVTLDRYGHLLPKLEQHLDAAIDRVGTLAREQALAAGGSPVGHAEVIDINDQRKKTPRPGKSKAPLNGNG